MSLNSISIKYVIVAVVCCIVIKLPRNCHAARILGYFPSSVKSHLLIHCAIAETLATAGHDVTVIGGAPNVYENAKYKYIHLPGIIVDKSFARELVNNPQPIYKRFGLLATGLTKSANESFSHPLMQKFLQENGEGSFDLLILGYLLNEFQLGLGGHFKCPMILSFMVQPSYLVNKFVGNPGDFSYIPNQFLGSKQPMDFLQRVKNFLLGLFECFFLDTLISTQNSRLYDFHFPASRYPSMEEVAKNISLIFSNHHSLSQGPIRPMVPAIVEIGGIQIKEKTSPLPEDIAAFLDNAKEGAIYLSFGTHVEGSTLEQSKVKMIFNVLAQLPYKVIWKWSDADLPGTSSNIFYKSWLPQNEILAHPNVKLFISHAGQGSVVESLHHAVPIVAMPLLGDQPSNAAFLVASGLGIRCDYATLREETLNDAILEVMENPKYAQAVQKFSKIYQDRPMTPRQLVIYWTEYVLRHNGAKHLQSPAVDMNLFQLLSLDVIAFLATILLVVVVILVKCCKFMCCRSNKSKALQKKKLK